MGKGWEQTSYGELFLDERNNTHVKKTDIKKIENIKEIWEGYVKSKTKTYELQNKGRFYRAVTLNIF